MLWRAALLVAAAWARAPIRVSPTKGSSNSPKGPTPTSKTSASPDTADVQSESWQKLTSLKIRKHFHWLSTILSVGADYSTNDGVWAMKWSWEDSIIGGQLTFKGSELQLCAASSRRPLLFTSVDSIQGGAPRHKNWIFAIGGAGNLAANLRLKGALDVATGKMSARFGFRTEQTAPINIVDGIDLMKRLPLDGHDGHAKLELKLRVAFPQPEIRADRIANADREADRLTRNDAVYIGMGDLQIDLDELNLCLDW